VNDPREILESQLTRRRFVQGTALAGFATFLAACGRAGTSAAPSAAEATAAPSTAPSAAASASAAPSASAEPTPKPSTSAELNFANWTYYLDFDPKTKKSPTLDQFKAKYGTKVNYQEVIDDNDLFVGTIKPQLEANQDTGWDLMALTDWMAARLIRLGWVEQMDLGNMPNVVANLQDVYKNVSWDPAGDHHVPWQSGMTGLGFDKSKTGNLTSVNEFYDPKYKGKVDYLTEMRDTIGLTMIKLGLDPSKATKADCDAAIAEIKKAKDAGIIRAFKGNEYAEDLKSGNIVLSMAWSGDIIQAQPDKPSLAFNVATEGGMLWSDNCLIPKGAKNAYTAQVMIDFCYDPKVAAQIEAAVNYICPVKGAAEVLLAKDPEMAKNPLIFPPADVLARLHIFAGLDEATEKYFNEQFATVTGLG
jgi:spermidine/putrescine transport system substrate-binding protein